MSTKYIYLGIIIIILVLAWFTVPEVWGQQSTRRMLEVLDQQGKEKCEIFQINDFLYTPVRINLVHQPVKNHQVSVTTEGGGEAFWDSTSESFQLVARDTDIYTAEIILDYETKSDEPRQVFFQIIAGERVIAMEGNWLHESFTFCKIIHFFAQKAPTELTEEEIIEINNKFNADFRREQASTNATIETGILVLAIITIIAIIMLTLYFMILIISQRSMANVSKRPEKKLNEMIGKVRKLAEVMTLQNQFLMTTNREMKDNIIKKIDNSLRDLAIMTVGTKNKIELENSFPKPDSLVPKKQVSTSSPVEIETVDKEQQIINEQAYADQFGLKTIEQARPEVNLVDLVMQDEPEQKTEPEPEEETIEIDLKEIKPCVYCGKAPMYYCMDCKKMYCQEHESHKCTGKEKKSLGASDSIASKIEQVIKNVMEKKDSITNDDLEMQKLLDGGKTKMEVKDELMKLYMKIPYKECREIYDKMVKAYDKKKTFLEAVRIEAMLERIVRSDT